MREQRGTGCIRWPKLGKGFQRTGENGMWVYAFWLADPTAQLDAGLELLTRRSEPRTVDPFVLCHGPTGTLTLPLPDVVATPDEYVYLGDRPDHVGPTGNAVERLHYLEHVLDAGMPVLGALCLGTTDSVVVDLSGTYWYATVSDLTRRGRRMTKMVSTLYGDRPYHLVTYVDT